MRAPGVVSGAYFEQVTDGLPSAWRDCGTRLACYTGRALDDLVMFIGSDEVATAVSDGVGWFDRFNELDFEPYTGNLYVIGSVQNRATVVPDAGCVLLVERFEVVPEHVAEFDRWLEASHATAIAAHPAVVRTRTGAAVREGLAIPYYYSLVNRVLLAEMLADAAGPGESLSSAVLARALEESMRWDRLLPYVSRAVYRPLIHVRATQSRAT